MVRQAVKLPEENGTIQAKLSVYEPLRRPRGTSLSAALSSVLRTHLPYQTPAAPRMKSGSFHTEFKNI
ncbi:hypothetical protein E2C01_098487 [Portunus trituberculatus]|uniref:Uncharacterized protein n=1 Tax=Portunus trituberculatus TaxID=210409 RepID=A0A5B7K743_PORTR|nr:hypothetical protein [Portunus trituberculatus]